MKFQLATKTTFISLLLIGFAISLQAQEEFEFSGLEFRYGLPANPEFTEDERLEETEYSFLEYRFFVNYSDKLFGKVDYFTSLGYHGMQWEVDFPNDQIKSDFPPYLSDPDFLHRVPFRFGPIFKLGEKWSMSTIGGAYVSSDLRSGFSSDDLTYDFTILFNYQKSKKKAFGFGTNVFFGQDRIIPFPVFTTYLQKGKWEITALLPLNLLTEYHLTEKQSVVLDVEVDFADFNLANDGQSVTTTFPAASLVEYLALFAGLNYNYTIKKHWNLFTGVSYAYRTFNFKSDSKDLDLNFENGALINIGIAYTVSR